MISKRLKSIGDFINSGETVADICCDHGLLGIYAIKQRNAKNVLLVDINPLPLEASKKNVLKANLTDRIEFALGDGLKPLKKKYDVITISGIGGLLMKSILSDGISKICEVKRLVLCPNNEISLVREFLSANYFSISEEVIIKDYKYYEIMVATPCKEKVEYTENEILFGPILLKKKPKEFLDFYQNKLSLLNKQIPNAISSDSYSLLKKKIDLIENAIK